MLLMVSFLMSLQCHKLFRFHGECLSCLHSEVFIVSVGLIVQMELVNCLAYVPGLDEALSGQCSHLWGLFSFIFCLQS